MSNTNIVLIPPNTTSHIQPLDAGIIENFKVNFKYIQMQWIIAELESGSATKVELGTVQSGHASGYRVG